MAFTSFFERFPKLVDTEFRNIHILDDKMYQPIVAGNYGFLELFCDELDCDCRNVVIYIISSTPYKVWVILRYGWEKKQFYADWFHGNPDNPFAQNMPGVFIDPMMATYHPTSEVWLKIFKQMLQGDKLYAKRIATHYQMFKDKLKEEQTSMRAKKGTDKKIGRNDLCLCNSGKKFKKCCGLKVDRTV